MSLKKGEDKGACSSPEGPLHSTARSKFEGDPAVAEFRGGSLIRLDEDDASEYKCGRSAVKFKEIAACLPMTETSQPCPADLHCEV